MSSEIYRNREMRLLYEITNSYNYVYDYYVLTPDSVRVLIKSKVIPEVYNFIVGLDDGW